jgi:phage shock protein PspC (stress-responsive transcriptional regulator)
LKSGAQRIGWFVLIWIASITALGIIAYAIRWAIMPA